MVRTLKITMLVAILACLLPHKAQAEWEKVFEGALSHSYNGGRSVCQTNDGGFIVVARTGLFGQGADVGLIRTDADGNKLWDKIYGGPRGDAPCCVRQTADGGYIVLAYTLSYGAGNDDIWLFKTDANGTMQWDKTFGGVLSEYGWDVRQTGDGGFAIVGHAVLIKTDADGNEQWSRTYGGWGFDLTADGGYIIAGGDYRDVQLIKTDSGGNAQWESSFGGTRGDVGHSVVQTPDGGYLIAGTTDSFAWGRRDIWLIKTDAHGDKVWDKTFGGAGIDGGWNVRIRATADNGFILLGDTHSFGAGRSDAWVIRIDGDGNEQWNRTFGDRTSNHARDIQPTADGGYVITGYTEPGGTEHYNVWLIKAEHRELTGLALVGPPDEAEIESPPEFKWSADGGEKNFFAVDLALSLSGTVWSTHEDLHETIRDSRWQMPQNVWDMIPSGSTCYWRVRGRDLDAATPTVITSDEVWSFRKE